MAIIGTLKHSRRCYHWLFVWFLINALLVWAIVSRGFIPDGTLVIVGASTLVFGYMFFIDISHKIWWTAEQVWWRGWDYLSIQPMRHSVRIDELTEVVTGYHAANWMPGRPFDRFLLVSPSDTITILPSFHRRQELEQLLRLLYDLRSEVFTDDRVTNFMSGDYADWWRYH
jgi:hypothetical protein